MKKNHTFSGFTFSFVLHVTLLALALALARRVPESEIPIVIDFSITHAAPKAASMVSKNAVNRMVARKPPVQPPKKRPSKPIRPKTAKIKKKKTPKPVKPAPEEIKAIKKETAEPPQEVAAVIKEEPVQSPPETLPELLPADSQMDYRSPEAQAATDGPEPMAGEAGPVGGGSMDPRARYIRAHFEYIKNTIQKKIIYPVAARKKGWQGKVVVSFVVDKEGNIMDIHIRESSGFFLLDRNAVQTIKKLGPFPPPPIRAELIVPINYSLV